jgi:hypothetical protein
VFGLARLASVRYGFLKVLFVSLECEVIFENSGRMHVLCVIIVSLSKYNSNTFTALSEVMACNIYFGA